MFIKICFKTIFAGSIICFPGENISFRTNQTSKWQTSGKEGEFKPRVEAFFCESSLSEVVKLQIFVSTFNDLHFTFSFFPSEILNFALFWFIWRRERLKNLKIDKNNYQKKVNLSTYIIEV